MQSTSDIQQLILQGEGPQVEFKVRVPSKVRELTEEVCAFANADGGYVLIGIDDKGKTVGANLDNQARSAIQGSISEISPALKVEMYAVTLEGLFVWVIDVPSGKDKPYIFGGSIYVREGANTQKLKTAEEMRQFFVLCNKIYFDAMPCKRFSLQEDVSPVMMADFRRESRISEVITDAQIFDNLQLITEEGDAKNAAAMFFSAAPERLFPHAVVRCVHFKGNDKVHIIDDKTFSGSLYHQYLDTMKWIESKLAVRYIIEDAGPRKEVWELPLAALREAAVNALCHRDYYEQGATIMVELYDNRLCVTNPGGLLPEVEKDFGHKSVSRNPSIVMLFTRMHLVEKVGSGIPRMQKEMLEAGLDAPVIHGDGVYSITFMKDTAQEIGGTTPETTQKTENTTPETTQKTDGTTLKKDNTAQENGSTTQETTQKSGITTQKTENITQEIVGTTQETTPKVDDTTLKTSCTTQKDEVTTQKTDGTTQKKLTSKQVDMMKLIASNPGISTEELALHLGITRDGVNWNIRQMKSKGLLERVGPDKGGYWRIIDK